MSICTTAVSQFAAVAALATSSEWLTGRMQGYAGRRRVAVDTLDQAGLGYIMPDAFPPLLIDVRHLGDSDVEIADRLATESGTPDTAAT